MVHESAGSFFQVSLVITTVHFFKLDKIRKWPKEYNSDIPNVTLAEYVLEKMSEFGDDVACVRSYLQLFHLKS